MPQLSDLPIVPALTGANSATDDIIPIHDISERNGSRGITVLELAKALVLAGSAVAPDADDFVLVLKADGSAIYKATITQILAAT